MRRTFALALAALFLFGVAQSAHFMSFELEGRVEDVRILTGIQLLFSEGKPEVGGLVLGTAVVAPLLWILLLIYVSGPLSLGRRPPGVAAVLRWGRRAREWSMPEVFLLAAIVTYVKLIDVAELGVGPAAWAYAIVVVLLAAAMSSFDRRSFWKQLEARP